ncbi:MAG TPA: DinB family protein [Gemmatimonadales bacterium]|nr:DinB family protein [Gemmatimonadales bacterium]
MNEELQDYLQQIEAVKRDAQALVSGLSNAQFNSRPGPGRWSIGECLVHLNVAVTTTLPAFDRGIERGWTRGLMGQGRFRYGWFANWMVRSMEPPVKRRMRTVKIFEVPPGATHSPGQVLPEFLRVRDQLAERVRRADGLDLRRARVVSPVTPLLRMPLGAYFAFVLAHERRHVWQARQVREAAGFPRL